MAGKILFRQSRSFYLPPAVFPPLSSLSCLRYVSSLIWLETLNTSPISSIRNKTEVPP